MDADMRFLHGSFLFLLFFTSIVIPNSLPEVNFALLTFAALVSVYFLKINKAFKLIFQLYLIGLIVTLIYMYVGASNGAPDEAMFQVSIIYIVSPLMWIVVSFSLFQMYSDSILERWIVLYTVLAIISVGVFFFLFINYGPESVEFFKKEANLNLSDGYAGATMFVYGSLIFLASGFFAESTSIRYPIFRLTLWVGLIAVALTSGRSALILSMPIGYLFGRLLLALQSGQPIFKISRRNIYGVIGFFVVILLIYFVFEEFTEIDLNYIAKLFFDKIDEGGGDVRMEQFYALLQGIAETVGMGAGHGIGVDYLRDDNFIWRYELVGVATIYRVGIIGFLIYLLPFVYYCFFQISNLKQSGISRLGVFFFSGFVAAAFAANTNPYIEAFSFQWMYVVPLVYSFQRCLIRS